MPYGFSLANDGVHLEPCAAEQKVIRKARALRAEGLSLRKIGARLTARKVLPRTGGAWHPPMIARMLEGVVG